MLALGQRRVAQEPGRLEADEHEAHAVQDPDEQRPGGVHLDARLRRDHVDPPGHDEAGDDDGEHAGGLQGVRALEGGVRGEEREREQRLRAPEHAVERREEEPAQHADRDRASGDPGEVQRDPTRLEGSREDDGHAELDADQAGRIVDQALTAEDRRGAPREAQALEHGLDRDGVRRRDDRAQDEAGGPGELRQHRPRHQSDDQDRAPDETHRQHGDRPQPAPEVHPRGVEGVRVEQRRKEEHEDQLGIEPRARQARHEGERDARQGEHHGQGQVVEPGSARARGCNQGQESDQDRQMLGHGALP
jgi:hypothetical protein